MSRHQRDTWKLQKLKLWIANLSIGELGVRSSVVHEQSEMYIARTIVILTQLALLLFSYTRLVRVAVLDSGFLLVVLVIGQK